MGSLDGRRKAVAMGCAAYVALCAGAWSAWWLSPGQTLERRTEQALDVGRRGGRKALDAALAKVAETSPSRAAYVRAQLDIEAGPLPNAGRTAEALRTALADPDVGLKAQSALAGVLLDNPNLERAPGEGLRLLWRAAQAGDDRAATRLARTVLNEGAAPISRRESIRLLHQAARTDPVAAEFLLQSYDDGGVRPISRQAADDLRIRMLTADLHEAREGKVSAMLRVADCYVRSGRRADIVKARDWYEKAVAKGSTSARLRLVTLLRRDRTMPDAARRAHELMVDAAKEGSQQAILELGIDFYRGRGVARDPAKGVTYLRRAADAGSISAMYHLADAYLKGEGVQASPALGVQYLERAADGGYGLAAYHLGTAYRTGLYGLTPDADRAIAWTARAAQLGARQAMIDMARHHSKSNAEDDEKTAFFWAARAVDAGATSPDLLVLLAEGYAGGEVVDQDLRRAETLLRRAVAQGSPTAMLRLGQVYFAYQDEAAQREAVGWLQRAAQRGQLYALIELGRAYASGAGVEINPGRALHYFRAAALAGSPQGMIEFGRSYATGYGVTQSAPLAAAWYLRAAQAGDPQGMILYANALERGEGVERSPVLSRAWMERSAATGLAEGRYWLAVYLLEGRGGPRDEARGRQVLDQAVEQRFPPAAALQWRLNGGGDEVADDA